MRTEISSEEQHLDHMADTLTALKEVTSKLKTLRKSQIVSVSHNSSPRSNYFKKPHPHGATQSGILFPRQDLTNNNPNSKFNDVETTVSKLMTDRIDSAKLQNKNIAKSSNSSYLSVSLLKQRNSTNAVKEIKMGLN